MDTMETKVTEKDLSMIYYKVYIKQFKWKSLVCFFIIPFFLYLRVLFQGMANEI